MAENESLMTAQSKNNRDISYVNLKCLFAATFQRNVRLHDNRFVQFYTAKYLLKIFWKVFENLFFFIAITTIWQRIDQDYFLVSSRE